MEHRLQHPRFAVYVLFGALVLDCMGFKEKVKLHVPSFFSFSDMFWHVWLLPSIAYNYTGSYRYFAIEIAEVDFAEGSAMTEQCHGGQPGH